MLMLSRRLGLLVILALIIGFAVAMPATSRATSASGLVVSVGYADDLHSSGLQFPTPWYGSPNTIFIGRHDGNPIDDGAIMLFNPTASTITVDKVEAFFDGTLSPRPITFNLWGSNIAIPPGNSLILTATSGDNFDTSDLPESCNPSTQFAPVVKVTVNSVETDLTDTARILDTGGTDPASCGGNEAHQWSQIGKAATAEPIFVQTPDNQSHKVNTNATTTAVFLDGSGSPLPNVPIDFSVISGPNTGATASVNTDANGFAAFTYQGTGGLGVDTVQACTTNLTGTTCTNDVLVTWVNATPALGPGCMPGNQEASGLTNFQVASSAGTGRVGGTLADPSVPSSMATGLANINWTLNHVVTPTSLSGALTMKIRFDDPSLGTATFTSLCDWYASVGGGVDIGRFEGTLTFQGISRPVFVDFHLDTSTHPTQTLTVEIRDINACTGPANFDLSLSGGVGSHTVAPTTPGARGSSCLS